MSHRIQLRDCTLYLLDGLAGAAAVNEPTTAPVADATTFAIDSVVLNTLVTDKVPVGARFTIAGETDATAIHVVTARTPADTGTTTGITFAPALGAGTYTKTAALTFVAQQLEVKLGDGDAKWDKNRQMKYDLDRGLLDRSVRPMTFRSTSLLRRRGSMSGRGRARSLRRPMLSIKWAGRLSGCRVRPICASRIVWT